MLTLFHSPQSRSSAIMALVEEMGITDRIETRLVSIQRVDGKGHRDPSNPHPEGKVPALVHDGVVITERAAIMLHLTALFPESGMAPKVGTPEWGAFATWLTWYQGVLEPVLIFAHAGLTHPWLAGTFRDPEAAAARFHAALTRGPWLLGDSYSAADLLLHSPYVFFPDATPDDPLIRDWVARCLARPSVAKVRAQDQAMQPAA